MNQFSKDQPIVFENLIDAELIKPGRYLGHELGIKPKDWDLAEVHWALSYPELYEVGASNLGHIILYSIINKVPGQLCDRAYLPGSDLAERLRQNSQPLFAVESRRPLLGFDILGFSLSYELGATNILEMLDLAQIPIHSYARQNLPLDHQASSPLIFAGGPTATSNPEPYADFFDFFALGDGEELLPEIGLIVLEGKKNNLSRSELLHDLSEVPGIYVPSLYKIGTNKTTVEPISHNIKNKIQRRVATPIPHYAMGLVPNIETVHDRLTIEIRRGCTRGCRFCQPGMLTRPARDVEPQKVINAIEKGMHETGYSDFSLLSLSCSDYLALPAVGVELRNRLAKQNVTLQLPSQRVDRFDDNIAHILGGSNQAGLTFAPEAGTQRLRDIINKGLTDEELIRGIRKAMANGYRKIKLYFMIGLPGETDSDVMGICSTCKMLQDKCSDLGRLTLNITISNFTPKPHTPFQWHSVSTNEFKRIHKLLKTGFCKLRGIKVNFTDIRLSAIEDFIGRGNRDIAAVIETAWREGVRMDTWFESAEQAHAAWTKAISSAGLNGKYRKLEMGDWSGVEQLSHQNLVDFCSQALPWDHIDTGIDKKWLIDDLQKALEAKVVADCSFNACSSCGVCGHELGHNIVIKSPSIPNQKDYQAPPSNKACRIRLQFEKTGTMSYLGHLDILRLLERGLRRSSLPISYTGGFHPLPRLQIALALPLGIEAYGEWMDIIFSKEIKASIVQSKLQKCLPEGLQLISANSILVNSPNLSTILKGAIWTFNLSTKTNLSPTTVEWGNAINFIKSSAELIWKDKDKKGRPRVKDYRNSLRSIKLQILASNDLDLSRITTAKIRLDTHIDEMGRSIKPIHIKHWIEKYLEHPLSMTDVKRDELQLHQC